MQRQSARTVSSERPRSGCRPKLSFVCAAIKALTGITRRHSASPAGPFPHPEHKAGTVCLTFSYSTFCFPRRRSLRDLGPYFPRAMQIPKPTALISLWVFPQPTRALCKPSIFCGETTDQHNPGHFAQANCRCSLLFDLLFFHFIQLSSTPGSF